MDIKAKFLQKYPFLAETRPNRFVGCYGGKFITQLMVPNFPDTARLSLLVYNGLQSVDVKKLIVSKNISHLLDDVLLFLDKKPEQCDKSLSQIDVDSLQKILKQIEKIKRDHRCKVFTNHDLSKLKFVGFKSIEAHHMEMIRISETDFQVTSHSLPDLGSSIELFKWHASVETHVATFVQILDQLDGFYSNLHTLDELCHVVEPPHIDTRTTWRIIKFSQKVFLKITLHPLQPTSVVVAFLGPTVEIEYLRELYNEKMEDWDADSSVYTNLLRILEIMAFPMPMDQSEENGETTVCGICMSYRDDHNKVPIISCDNEKCSLIFHIGCLKEWFMSLKDSRTFFAISVGTCPYCKQKVSSSFDEMLSNLELVQTKSAA